MCKLLCACMASLVLFSFAGCGDKGPTRVVDDKQQTQPDPNKR